MKSNWQLQLDFKELKISATNSPTYLYLHLFCFLKGAPYHDHANCELGVTLSKKMVVCLPHEAVVLCYSPL